MAEKKKNTSKPVPPAAGSGGPMDVGLLEQIVQLMSANDLNTVDLRDGQRRVILKRGQAVVQVAALAPAAGPAPAAAPSGGGTGQPTAAQAAASEEAGLVPVKSPMVGTFYSSPKPGEKAFVGVGSVVNEESDVCIIEAMKTFNTHKAGVSGTIAKVLAIDGQTVQFDQPLFLVKP